MASIPIDLLANAAQDLVEARLREGMPVRFYVYTTSMLPTIRPGDALIVERGVAAEFTPGAVVIVRNGNTWVVHRLIRREANGERLNLLIKGDNRSLADPSLNGSVPVGVVKSIQRGERSINLQSWRVRNGGRVLAWLSGVQASLGSLRPGLFRGIIMGSLQRGIYSLAFLVYRI